MMNIKELWNRSKITIVSILIAMAVGGLAALITHNSMEIFESLNKPPLSPPGAIFPIVWSILFLLMGISAARIYRAPKSEARTRALTVYFVQLVLNFGCTILFFGAGLYYAAFIWLIVLAIMILVMILSFYPIDRLAALLQIPYFLWVAFAGYLNFMIARLN